MRDAWRRLWRIGIVTLALLTPLGGAGDRGGKPCFKQSRTRRRNYGQVAANRSDIFGRHQHREERDHSSRTERHRQNHAWPVSRAKVDRAGFALEYPRAWQIQGQLACRHGWEGHGPRGFDLYRQVGRYITAICTRGGNTLLLLRQIK